MNPTPTSCLGHGGAHEKVMLRIEAHGRHAVQADTCGYLQIGGPALREIINIGVMSP